MKNETIKDTINELKRKYKYVLALNNPKFPLVWSKVADKENDIGYVEITQDFCLVTSRTIEPELLNKGDKDTLEELRCKLIDLEKEVSDLKDTPPPVKTIKKIGDIFINKTTEKKFNIDNTLDALRKLNVDALVEVWNTAIAKEEKCVLFRIAENTEYNIGCVIETLSTIYGRREAMRRIQSEWDADAKYFYTDPESDKIECFSSVKDFPFSLNDLAVMVSKDKIITAKILSLSDLIQAELLIEPLDVFDFVKGFDTFYKEFDNSRIELIRYKENDSINSGKPVAVVTFECCAADLNYAEGFLSAVAETYINKIDIKYHEMFKYRLRSMTNIRSGKGKIEVLFFRR